MTFEDFVFTPASGPLHWWAPLSGIPFPLISLDGPVPSDHLEYFLGETFLIISLLSSFFTFFKALITRQSYLRYFHAFLLSPLQNYQLCKGKTASA